MKYLKWMAFIGFAFVALAIPAWAQTTPTGTLFTWDELLSPIIMTLGSILAVALTAAATMMLKKIGIDIDLATQEKVSTAAKIAAGYGLNLAKDALIKDKTIDVKSEMIAQAVRYYKEKWPDLVKKLGLDDAAIADIITARIGVEVTDPTIKLATK